MRDASGVTNEVKPEHKGGMIAVASAARSIRIDLRSWVIDGQMHASIELPHATQICQSAEQSRAIVHEAAAAIFVASDTHKNLL